MAYLPKVRDYCLSIIDSGKMRQHNTLIANRFVEVRQSAGWSHTDQLPVYISQSLAHHMSQSMPGDVFKWLDASDELFEDAVVMEYIIILNSLCSVI